MIAYRQQAWKPNLSQAVVVPSSAGITDIRQATGVTTVGSPVQGLLWTTVASAAAYAAIRTAMREKGFASIAGYVGGIGAGLAALMGLIGIVSPATAQTIPVRWY